MYFCGDCFPDSDGGRELPLSLLFEKCRATVQWDLGRCAHARVTLQCACGRTCKVIVFAGTTDWGVLVGRVGMPTDEVTSGAMVNTQATSAERRSRL
jgi:hypothetical protein